MIKHVDGSSDALDFCAASGCLDILNALSDETRLQILALFYTDKELCVTDIADRFKLSRPTISHHLILMKRAKLLNSRKEGKEIFYSFNRDHVIGVMESILESLKNCGC